MSRTRLAIFASGDGTNAENIIRHFEDHAQVDVSLVVSNKAEAGVLERAEKLGIDTAFIPREDWTDEDLVRTLLEAHDIHWIALCGFLLLVPAYLIRAFEQRMVNIHPALLPKFGGKGMYGMHVHRAVKEAREQESGITIHLVNEVYDEGRTLFQERVALSPSDDAEDIRQKVQALEHRHFPKVLEALLTARQHG